MVRADKRGVKLAEDLTELFIDPRWTHVQDDVYLTVEDTLTNKVVVGGVVQGELAEGVLGPHV